MSDQPTEPLTEFRPAAVVVREEALGDLRSLAGRYGLHPKRVYGLAMEYATGEAEADDLEAYVEQHRRDI